MRNDLFSWKSEAIRSLKEMLQRDPSLAPDLLIVITSFITEVITKARKEMDDRARAALELCIVELGRDYKGRNAAETRERYRGTVLARAFEAYAPDGNLEGQSDGVKKAWEKRDKTVEPML